MLRKKLLKELEELNRESEKLFVDLETYSQEQLQHKLGPEVWSPTEVLQHLLLAERLSLAYCKKKLSFEPKLKKANIRTWVNCQIIVLSLISPFKIKAPKVVSSSELGQQILFHELRSAWLSQRHELRRFLESVPDHYLDKEVYKHAFGLRLSLYGMLKFSKAHFRRHQRQVLRRL